MDSVNKDTRLEFENRLRDVVGRELTGVRYIEIAYEGGQPAWNYDERFDSLDFGLELEFDVCGVTSVVWGWEFFQFGLSLGAEWGEGQWRKWDVGVNSRWADYLGRRLVSADLVWVAVQADHDPNVTIEYPQDLILRFADRPQVIVSAAEIVPHASFYDMMDHVTVVFGEASARELGIGPAGRLASSSVETDGRNMAGLPKLHRAVKRQDAAAVGSLLAGGADPNAEAAGSTPLMYAAKLCNTRVMRLLLDAGADPNWAGPGDWTPLAVAASKGSHSAVALLLESGADPRRQLFGGTVLDLIRRHWPERRRLLDLLESALQQLGDAD